MRLDISRSFGVEITPGSLGNKENEAHPYLTRKKNIALKG